MGFKSEGCEIAVSIVVVVFIEERELRGVCMGMNQKCDSEVIWNEWGNHSKSTRLLDTACM